MSEDNVYKDGDIVWVKLGNNWWPGEVTGPARHPEGLITHLKRVPYCVVKFFNENSYEYVRSGKQIFPFQCPKQEEFIRKGYSLYNSGNAFMEKFPADVEVARQLILRKESSFIVNDRPDSIVKAILGQPLIRTYDECSDSSEQREKRHSRDSVTKILNITPNRNNDSFKIQQPQPKAQTCDFCDFTSVRLNVMILHRKIHSNRNSTNNSTLKQITANSTTSSSVKSVANRNVEEGSDKKLYNQSLKNDVNNITKASRIPTTKVASPRTPSPRPRLAAGVIKTNISNSANKEGKTVTISRKETNNGNIKFTTPKTKIKATKNSTIKEKKEENVYAAILSDFCPSETETSSSEEKQSRRSLRNYKNIIETTAEKMSTVCIDLSESKTIQKIPKKREYSTLQLENEGTRPILSSVIVGEPDVVCLSDKEKVNSASKYSTVHSVTAKKNAEDIRRMLLADWSDDDETPADTSVIDVNSVLVNTELHDSSDAPKGLENSASAVVTSTPFIKSSTTGTGRIRNIPKKDRRDVVLQDFNSDLSFMQYDNTDHVVNKTVAVDLDSSNSSGVEIIDEQQPGSIITINDDEEIQEISKIQNDVKFLESKVDDSSVLLTNDKPTSAATSTSTLSCFDFQEDEDEHDNTATTISHFKKKFLSGEKLPNFLSNTTDDLKDNVLAKNRAELVEKDQRLAADIETLLEQTQPTVVDLLNASSFEESLSVKDLPIKERGKRIFKSRNKTRLANESNTDLYTSAEMNFLTEPPSTEQDKDNTTEDGDSPYKDQSEPIAKASGTGEIVEMTLKQEVATDSKRLTEILNQEDVVRSEAETPNCFEDTQSTQNGNKDNETSTEKNKDCLKISIVGNNSNHSEPLINDKLITSDIIYEHINDEKDKDDATVIHHENNVLNNEVTEQLQDAQEEVVNPQQVTESYPEQETFATIDQTQTETQNTIIPIINEIPRETCTNDETSEETVLHLDDKESCDPVHVSPSEFNDVQIKDKKVDKVKVLEIQIFKQSRANLENVLEEKCPEEIVPAKSISEMATDGGEKSPKKLDNGPSNKESQNADHKIPPESVFKIRVKSPEQLLEQAFVMASQQDQELQGNMDIGVDARLISTTPTDENSSMCASDTGAEFGSPTSMLSEERLPAFRFQRNRTPPLEIETVETTELLMHNVAEVRSKSETHNHLTKQHFPIDKLQNDEIVGQQKSLLQRRYSMDLHSMQTELKPIKRQRLSVDDIAANKEKSFEKIQDKSLRIHQEKPEIRVRPKSRHMKITPRRNVSELFKEHNQKRVANVTPKCSPLVKENQSLNKIITTLDEERVLKGGDNSPINENCKEASKEKLENRTEAIQLNKEVHRRISDTNILSEAAESTELETLTENEVLETSSEERQDGTIYVDKEATNKEECNSKAETQVETNIVSCSAKEIKSNNEKIEVLISTEANQPDNVKSNPTETTLKNGSKEIVDVIHKSILDANIEEVSNNTPEVKENFIEPASDTEKNQRKDEISKSTSSDTVALETSKTEKDQLLLENATSPENPPSMPQDREVVINKTQHETPTVIDTFSDPALHTADLKEKENSVDVSAQPLTTQEKFFFESDKKENEPLQEVSCSLKPLEKDSIVNSSSNAITIPANTLHTNKCETLVEPSSQQSLDMVIEFDNTLAMPCTPIESNVDEECENGIHIPCTPQTKDLIIECEPSTPQCIIECDHNLPTEVTPEKEVIIESDITSNKRQDIIIEENIRLDEGEILLEREFRAIQRKESCVSIDIPQESQTNSLQTDADKAAEEFLIEFDSIVNHSHTVEQDAQNSTVEEALNADDLINNIIEEVHEEPQPKEVATTKSEEPPPIQFQPLTTYTVVANKNSWHQIFKDSFNKQLTNPAKRRQTICFEISDTKEGVACKKQAFDIESVLPINKTIKRTAERKLTLPAIETKVLSSSQPHNLLTFNHNQITVNKKLIPTTKRKLSIEDNITPFIIERPQPQNGSNAINGPPPLQRIRPLRRQSHIITKSNVDSMSEPPPLQSHDNLLNDLFPTESAASTQGMVSEQKLEGGRVIHQQIVSGPTTAISATHQIKSTDTKISKNKQIGVDSRGNKYVIIKTPPTDIVVQPSLTSSTAAAIPSTNNFGSTITFQPLARSSSDINTTKPITKNKNTSKQQLHQQQMKQIAITVPGKSTLEVLNLTEITAKTALRNRRKAAQAKAVATAASATATNNINSAKHRQAMEALTRRLSIASETPPLSKTSRTSSAIVQTQFSNNSNLTTLFGDAQIPNIAQQQLIQLQQQQQITQTSASSLAPPIILNKNAHHQSVIQRKPRKIPSQQQAHLQHQQLAAAKSSQLLQQQNSVQQQGQQLQSQIIAQIAAQEQTQQHHPIQPPLPLQQIQQQTEPLQQQIVHQSDMTSPATEDDDVIISNSQLIALPTQPYPGYPETFLLCKVKGNTFKPVDNVPLYLNKQLNELVPVPLEAIERGHKTQEHQIDIKPPNAPQQLLANQNNDQQDSESNLQIANINCNLVDDEISVSIESEHQIQNSHPHQIMEECVVDENGATGSNNQICNFAGSQELNTELVSNNGILLNIEGQQVLLDAATFAHLLANPDANTQLISDDGTEYVLTHEVLQALQIQQEQQQALELLNAATGQQQQQLEQTGNNDIIAVALAGSDLYDNDVLTIDTSQGMQLIDGDGSIVFPAQSGSITQQHLTPPAVVTNAVLDQSPIMSTLEVPSSLATVHKLQGSQLITVPSHHLAASSNAALGLGGRANLEDSLAAIGVTSQSSSIPTSLGLPITVTNPNIASKVTSAGPLNEMLQFVSHRPATAAATAAAVAAAALAGETRIFND